MPVVPFGISGRVKLPSPRQTTDGIPSRGTGPPDVTLTIVLAGVKH